jgi:hypothetical protein
MTWREIIYIIEDITKQFSDDSNFNEEHIAFLCSEYRNTILNQQYLTGKKTINDANYQLICLTLCPNIPDICPSDNMLKSVEEVPFTMPIGIKQAYPTGMYGSKNKFSYISINRLPYVGNTFTRNNIYVSIAPDNHLYIKSNNENFIYLEKIQFKAIFEDIQKASILELQCKTGNNECSYLDARFPLEDAFIGVLMQYVVNDLIKGTNMLRDEKNDANDDSDQLARQISLYTNNAFKRMMQGNKANQNEQ